jgi:hypothetical protein
MCVRAPTRLTPQRGLLVHVLEARRTLDSPENQQVVMSQAATGLR